MSGEVVRRLPARSNPLLAKELPTDAKIYSFPTAKPPSEPASQLPPVEPPMALIPDIADPQGKGLEKPIKMLPGIAVILPSPVRGAITPARSVLQAA